MTIGDIVPLNAGVVIPADMVLIDSKDLFLNQSAFTGESVPVEKKRYIRESLMMMYLIFLMYVLWAQTL